MEDITLRGFCDVKFYFCSFFIPKIFLKKKPNIPGLLITTTFIVLPPMQQNQHFIRAIDRVTIIIEMITITSDSGNRNESVSPSPKASEIMPCFLYPHIDTITAEHSKIMAETYI